MKWVRFRIRAPGVLGALGALGVIVFCVFGAVVCPRGIDEGRQKICYNISLILFFEFRPRFVYVLGSFLKINIEPLVEIVA